MIEKNLKRASFDTYLNFITSKLIMDQFSMEITVPLVGSDKVTHPTGIKILLFHFYLSFPFSPLSLAGSGLDVVARLVVGSVVENGPHDRERARHPHNFSFSPFFCHTVSLRQTQTNHRDTKLDQRKPPGLPKPQQSELFRKKSRLTI